MSFFFSLHLLHALLCASFLSPFFTLFRWLTTLRPREKSALFAAAFISNSPGSIVDVTHEEYRALAMSLWSIAPLNGPVTGPMIGGFVFEYLGWRWNNWIVLILAGAAIVGIFTCRETYAPEILKRKVAKLRKETDDDRWWCKYDEKVSKWQLLLVNMGRPFVMSWTEPILWFFNVW